MSEANRTFRGELPLPLEAAAEKQVPLEAAVTAAEPHPADNTKEAADNIISRLLYLGSGSGPEAFC